jgi:hypothetical protein
VSISVPDEPRAVSVKTSKGRLTVELEDGRTLTVPLSWFPRLSGATAKQLADHRLIGGGVGITWPKLDEDLSVRGLLMQSGPVRKTG